MKPIAKNSATPVSMLPGFIRSVQFTARAALLSSVLIAGFGCAEAITYSKDAHKEGMSLYEQGDYVDAAAAFSNAVRQNPRDYPSYFYLGASYQAAARFSSRSARTGPAWTPCR